MEGIGPRHSPDVFCDAECAVPFLVANDPVLSPIMGHTRFLSDGAGGRERGFPARNLRPCAELGKLAQGIFVQFFVLMANRADGLEVFRPPTQDSLSSESVSPNSRVLGAIGL